MSDKFIVEIISPDQTILEQETSEVIIPSFEGQMGILKDHISLITFLRPGFILIKGKKEKKKIDWLLAGGINLSNVSKAIKITKTKGLDISSGVEISKGIKSSQLIKSFVKKCRNI